MKNRCLVVTGGGDCPGLNAVIRAIVKRASLEKDWEIIGSINAFNGVLLDPMEIIDLDLKTVAGIHVRGGTIIGTTNKGGPFEWPVKQEDGSYQTVDRSAEMLRKLEFLNIKAIINIGGDGSQRISQRLYDMGCNIIGVPKTIDNDLGATDTTFGFPTAVEIATEALDKLVTTAASHNRILIMEVMGRAAGWIALHSAVAGGAEVCLIPEIPYDVEIIKEHIEKRIVNGRGFVNIVIAEGAKPIDGKMLYHETEDKIGTFRLGGAGIRLKHELKEAGVETDIRVTNLGHTQRGGKPIAYDRILATQFGVKAFEMVLEKEFGKMVAIQNEEIIAVPICDAIEKYNFVEIDSDLMHTARKSGISFGEPDQENP
ncbi:MAG: ATP-dependent 6-phosphofructokinase [Candidatus Cloacimonetes bacterium]|nr:ATP-dependent 6-phosphofructokinase [Candidatus Cloacimonadota bacterium]MCF7814208.1 ATP-dependent 6-phosphofructokinase [Candidatus Cloacimonadota bacterium]MCF7868133.1 ATP-dependent 6-phosphofructokinase [Candidatus Cloacimonadota bacterium]MCF7883599.1 ATP-dependent 6-phosphofructokinase [Candidatus Cloacimonadota bacterium]